MRRGSSTRPSVSSGSTVWLRDEAKSAENRKARGQVADTAGGEGALEEMLPHELVAWAKSVLQGWGIGDRTEKKVPKQLVMWASSLPKERSPEDVRPLQYMCAFVCKWSGGRSQVLA